MTFSTPARQLLCQECCGTGENSERVIATLEPMRYECGWCKGSGKVDASTRGVWLASKRAERRIAKGAMWA